jgi:hypothetical protein
MKWDGMGWSLVVRVSTYVFLSKTSVAVRSTCTLIFEYVLEFGLGSIFHRFISACALTFFTVILIAPHFFFKKNYLIFCTVKLVTTIKILKLLSVKKKIRQTTVKLVIKFLFHQIRRKNSPIERVGSR